MKSFYGNEERRMENLKPKVEMPPEWKINQQKRQKLICPKCGSKISKGSVVCPKCGKNISY